MFLVMFSLRECMCIKCGLICSDALVFGENVVLRNAQLSGSLLLRKLLGAILFLKYLGK